MQTALFLATAVLVFQIYFWGTRLWEIVQTARSVPEIDPERDSQLPPKPPLISIIVPACDEQTGIGACLQSVLDQDYPCFELIFVNDRSYDNTLAIAELTTRGRTNVRIISVTDLPAVWTGKCHALDVGVQQASGEWLAFLDADSRLHRAGSHSITHNLFRKTSQGRRDVGISEYRKRFATISSKKASASWRVNRLAEAARIMLSLLAKKYTIKSKWVLDRSLYPNPWTPLIERLPVSVRHDSIVGFPFLNAGQITPNIPTATEN